MPQSRGAIRLGIIGCGRGTEVHHLPALARIPEIRVVAIADINAARLRRTADRFGIAQRYDGYPQMLRDADIDAVAVVTPTQSHAEIGLAALHMGKHLFMEKPLALNLEECDQLIEAASRTACKTMVGLNNRWHRLVVRARDMVRSGALGKLKAIRSVYTHCHSAAGAPEWHRKRELGGGVLFNDGVHHFDLWRYLLDTEVTEVFAHSVSTEHFEDDTCTISARLGNGIVASAVIYFSTSANSELEIFGDAGRMLLSLYRFDGLEFFANTVYPGSLGSRLHAMTHTLQEIPGAFASIRNGGEFSATYEALWRHFADCIQKGAVPACTLEDGKKALQIAIAALDSSQSRIPVEI